MLTERQQAIIIGTLLGDGHLEKNGLHVRLKIDHGNKQSDYVQWKYQELKTIAAKEPVCVKFFDKRTQQVYIHLRFATKSLSILDYFKDLFYDGRRKIVPPNLEELLNSPLSLAVWYMDDGYLRKDCKALHLNTQGYSENEQKVLQGCLERNFGVVTRVHWARGKPKLYIPSEMTEKFCGIIRSHIIPEMYRKLP